jgi:RNA polymerase sigma-70 factor (ECF subfamily)
VDASDLVQESLLRSVRSEAQFQGTGEAEYRSWLREILENLITDAKRFHSRECRDVANERVFSEAAICSQGDSPSAQVRQSETQGEVQQALEILPEDYRTVLRLRQEQELSFAEIGVVLQRSPDAARMLWGRAIVELGRLLKAKAHERSAVVSRRPTA